MPTRMSTRDDCCVRAMRASSMRDWRSVERGETLSRARAIVKICGWFGLTRVD